MFGGKGGMLQLKVKDKKELYMSYMPFLKNGGIFIHQKELLEMGKSVFIVIDIESEKEQIPVSGTVAWIKPSVSVSENGVGIRFDEQDNGATKDKIEKFLAGALGSDIATYTM